MDSALLVVAIVVAVVLAAVIAVQRVKYKNLVQQTQKSMDDLQAKEAIMQKEAMIKAKEALHNEREQLNEDERERRREFAAIETKLSKREDLIENKMQEITDKEVELDKMKDQLIEKEDLLDVKSHIIGTPMEFDLIKYEDQYAINQCSMGLDAEVCAKQAHFKKIPFLSPEAAYTVSLLYCFIGKMKNTFTIQFDDDEPFTKDVLFCVVGNSRWYGGGYMAAPKALTYDGLLDFVVVEKDCTRLTLLGLINPYKQGKHLEWKRTHFKRGKKITIKSEKPSAVNFDGEVKIVTEATFNIVEKAIKYVVPANSDFMKKVEEGTL